ncbi:hypothetical protein JCGZ_22515 [Jatropha curcas]|uniref:Uncharacterized protein n=2 Tax=Jatropha curcas TaxID=180498 RepID=A0A067JSM3_JATCU|nr:hypothetical protein JCGZ_22515 [Jatropha curcas]
MWPGIYGNAGGASSVVSNMRKRAVQASRFMLQMMQAPLFAKQTEIGDENASTELPEVIESISQPSFECGEEGLAIRIAAEVASFNVKKKTSAEKSYISALSRIIVLLHFRPSEQGAIKLMRRVLNLVADSVSAEKDIVKELKQMAEHLKSLDKQPNEELLQDQANLLLERLELDINLDADISSAIPQTPAPSRSAKPVRSRRRVRHEEDTSSDEETSLTTVVQTINGTEGTRSQRASKTAALTKMTTKTVARIDECDSEEEGSDVTTEDDSDDSE